MERKTTENKIRCKTVEIQDAMKSMDEAIEQVESILRIGKTKARLLLSYFKWDSFKLIEQYFSKENPEKLLREAKIGLEPGPPQTIAHHFVNVTCGLCSEEVSPKGIRFLSCKHVFCTTCWTSYLKKIVDLGMTDGITCPQLNCAVNIGQHEIHQLTLDKHLSLKYREQSVSHFISGNAKYKRCPADGCDKILVFDSVNHGTKRVKCSCGHEFCFSCGGKWHSPLTCSNFKRWTDKVDEKLETGTLETGHNSRTKNCRNCKAMIRKDGGGNIKICRNKTCRNKFCWDCLRPRLRCGRCKCGASLNDFDVNLSGYLTNRRSLKLKNMLLETFEKTITDLKNGTSIPWINWFLQKAVTVLDKCRQTLMCSYALSYFLPEDNETIIFRNNQMDLQESVAVLSKGLGSLSQEIPEELKRALITKCQYCDSRRKVLKNHIREIQ